jgi:hypothetical protein
VDHLRVVICPPSCDDQAQAETQLGNSIASKLKGQNGTQTGQLRAGCHRSTRRMPFSLPTCSMMRMLSTTPLTRRLGMEISAWNVKAVLAWIAVCAPNNNHNRTVQRLGRYTSLVRGRASVYSRPPQRHFGLTIVQSSRGCGCSQCPTWPSRTRHLYLPAGEPALGLGGGRVVELIDPHAVVQPVGSPARAAGPPVATPTPRIELVVHTTNIIMNKASFTLAADADTNIIRMLKPFELEAPLREATRVPLTCPRHRALWRPWVFRWSVGSRAAARPAPPLSSTWTGAGHPDTTWRTITLN